jgi:hypothetical protein
LAAQSSFFFAPYLEFFGLKFRASLLENMDASKAVVVQFRGLGAVPDPDSTLAAMDAKYVFMADPVRPSQSFFQARVDTKFFDTKYIKVFSQILRYDFIPC